MPQKLFLFFVLLLGSSLYIKAQQNYAVEDISKALVDRADATVREERIEIDMKSATQVAIRITRAVTIHNKNGESYGDIELYYNRSRKIKKVKGEVLNEFGIPIGKFSLKDFQDRSASGQSNLYDDARV